MTVFADDDLPDDYIPDSLPAISKEAYVTAPVSAEEGAIGTTDRYGVEFDKLIFKTYPDIKKIKYVPEGDMLKDKEDLGTFKDSFYRSLYFSKLIKLANGQTLFDFLMKCAVLNRTVSSADRITSDSNEFALQYFIKLKQINNNKIVGESIYFNRVSNKFISDRTPFAFFMISDENFMKTFGLKCAK